MNNIFTQMGFTDPTQGILSASAKAAHGWSWGSIPVFMGAQIVSTIVCGKMQRNHSRKEAKARIEHMKEMEEFHRMIMEHHQQMEIEHMYRMFEEGIQYQREYSKRLMESRRHENEFEYFCETTWKPRFKPEIIDIFDKHDHPVLNSKGGTRINIMLARTKDLQGLIPAWGIDQKANYSNFAEDFTDYLGRHEHFNTMWLRMWNKPSLGVVADSMNIFYLMQGLPTVILFLYEMGNRLSVEATIWGFHVGHENMMSSKVIDAAFMDSNKEDVAFQLLTAATAFLCDSFNEPFNQLDTRLYPSLESKISNSEIKDKILSQYLQLDDLNDTPLMKNLRRHS